MMLSLVLDWSIWPYLEDWVFNALNTLVTFVKPTISIAIVDHVPADWRLSVHPDLTLGVWHKKCLRKLHDYLTWKAWLLIMFYWSANLWSEICWCRVDGRVFSTSIQRTLYYFWCRVITSKHLIAALGDPGYSNYWGRMRLIDEGWLVGQQVRLLTLETTSSCLVQVYLRCVELTAWAGRTILNSHLLIKSLRKVYCLTGWPHFSCGHVTYLIYNLSASGIVCMALMVLSGLGLWQIVRKLLLVGRWAMRAIIRIVHD